LLLPPFETFPFPGTTKAAIFIRAFGPFLRLIAAFPPQLADLLIGSALPHRGPNGIGQEVFFLFPTPFPSDREALNRPSAAPIALGPFPTLGLLSSNQSLSLFFSLSAHLPSDGHPFATLFCSGSPQPKPFDAATPLPLITLLFHERLVPPIPQARVRPGPLRHRMPFNVFTIPSFLHGGVSLPPYGPLSSCASGRIYFVPPPPTLFFLAVNRFSVPAVRSLCGSRPL